MQSANGLVVLVDRRHQGVLVRWIAGGEAIEAVQEDDRSIVGVASLFAPFIVVLLTQTLVFGAQAAAVKPQQRQAGGQDPREADHPSDRAGPDRVARHRLDRGSGAGRTSMQVAFSTAVDRPSPYRGYEPMRELTLRSERGLIRGRRCALLTRTRRRTVGWPTARLRHRRRSASSAAVQALWLQRLHPRVLVWPPDGSFWNAPL